MLTTAITPRFCETDLLGHVNNTALPAWFEQGRQPLFGLFCDDLPAAACATFPLILAHLDLDFRREVFFGTDVEIRTGVARIGTCSFTVRQEAWQHGQLCVEGNAVIVHYNHVLRQSLPIPGPIRVHLEACMVHGNGATAKLPTP